MGERNGTRLARPKLSVWPDYLNHLIYTKNETKTKNTEYPGTLIV